MRIIFNIEYRTVWGETLCISGDIPGLGSSSAESAVEMTCEGEGHWSYILDIPDNQGSFRYRYLVKHNGYVSQTEWGPSRTYMPEPGVEVSHVYDSWSSMPYNKSFYSSAFTDGIFLREFADKKAVKSCRGTITLRVAAPMIQADEVLAITGNLKTLGNWNISDALLLNDKDFPEWSIVLDASNLSYPFEYKFVILKKSSRDMVAWEAGDNRYFNLLPPGEKENLILSGLRFVNPSRPWKGAGVAIPVFSLRSDDSFGVGEFRDLMKLVDWAVETGQKFVQILPINDTTMAGTWQDSYPYNANSTFALHPQYIHLQAVGLLSDKAKMIRYEKLGKELNSLEEIDYERVNRAKSEYLKDIFVEIGEYTLAQPSFRDFFKRNRSWLVPYAAFCSLRDRFGTSDFSCWGEYAVYEESKIISYTASDSPYYKEVSLVYFIQYHLHLQMSEVRNYARQEGVVLKGDIPIGISRTSVDAWVNPRLFHLDSQAGAPPDDFSVSGQNWGFPTYNWEEMARDGYEWWKARFRKMAEYFDAYRIDHILGFFRIWEIPCDAVQGLLGHFNPALPFTPSDLQNYGFEFHKERHATPYIYDYFLGDFFGEYTGEVISSYLEDKGYGRKVFRNEVDTQRKVVELFSGKEDEKSLRIKNGLLGLLDEVLFVEDPVKQGYYHPRISAQYTYSYRALSDGERWAYDKMYNDFFYHRHNEFWKQEAMRKLPPLISSTRMLVCGEDLGMIPHCVPEVMKTLQILSLEIQRMPKYPEYEFGDIWHYPYLSVCTTSTHDMSPIRAWWEEDRSKTQRFYNQVLHEGGQAPFYCEPWVCEKIIYMHLNSPSMLAILPLQDWLSMDGKLRRENPQEERINVPANSRHYWRYRMHLTLEELLEQEDFNRRIRRMIGESGR